MTHYFEKFPIREYPLSDKRIVNATDIVARVVFSTGAQDNLDIVDEYQIQEGDRPDTIAEKFYGDDTLWWIVLLFNDIFDPYFDWALGFHCTEENIKKNYPGIGMFIRSTSSNTVASTNVKIRVNDTIASYTNSAGTSYAGVRGLVYDWDMNLQRMLVQGVTGGTFGVGDYVKVVGCSGSHCNMFVVEKMLNESYYSLDHFEDPDGNRLNPLSQYVPSDYDLPLGADGNTVFGLEAVSYDNCLLQNYISGDDATYAVTIWEKVMREYDDKRTIKILRPDYVPKVIEVTERLLNA